MLKRIRDLFRPAVPDARRPRVVIAPDDIFDVFAIGDVHGRYDLLVDAEKRILAMPDRTEKMRLVVLLGDYIDRGPDSRRVLDHLLKPLPRPFHRICLCGNHDDAFWQFIRRPKFDRAWLGFGGDATLRSYGIDSEYLLRTSPDGTELRKAVLSDVPSAHVEFLEKAPVSLLLGEHLFVHAGVVPGRPLDQQTDQDLMWIREPFLTQGSGSNLTIIHGHTPATDVVFGNKRIGIDTGAYMTDKLSVLHIRENLVSVMDS